MGGNISTKRGESISTRRERSKQPVVQTISGENSKATDWFSVASIKCTLVRDTHTDIVSLQDEEFTLNLPVEGLALRRICSLSRSYYLALNSGTQTVVKFNSTTRTVQALALPGIPEHLCEFGQNAAAVSLCLINSDKRCIQMLETTNELRTVNYFGIPENCIGIVHVSSLLYVCFETRISVYERTGQFKEDIFKRGSLFKPDGLDRIMSMAKGLNNSLVCLHGSIFDWYVDIINTKGGRLKNLFTYSSEIPAAPQLFVSSLSADLKGNVYMFNNSMCLKITQKGKTEEFPFPGNLFDTCYDPQMDMLLMSFQGRFVLKSTDLGQAIEICGYELDTDLFLRKRKTSLFS